MKKDTKWKTEFSLMIKARCFATGKHVNTTSINIIANSGECELCGDHGEITIKFECPHCKAKTHIIRYDSW